MKRRPPNDMSKSTPHRPHGPPKSIEAIKERSDYLRGKIAAELAEPTDHFTPETAQLLKHHGVYQQDDRDHRVLLGDSSPKRKVAYQFMIRTAVPGGRLSGRQFLAHLDLAEKFGDGTLRITSRQDLQTYGVAKADLRAVLKRIGEIGLTTISACGDINRNVVCCPAPFHGDPVHGQMQWMAGQIAAALFPRTPAYREIWLDKGARSTGFSRKAKSRLKAELQRRSSRSTAKRICRGSSRLASACRATTARMSIRMTSGCWQFAAIMT